MSQKGILFLYLLLIHRYTNSDVCLGDKRQNFRGESMKFFYEIFDKCGGKRSVLKLD